jgi:flagellar biosynthesis anti-sigma factor FlgM
VKVTNNGLPNNGISGSTKLETGKAGKSDATKTLGKDPKSIADRAAVKDSANINVSERAQMMQKAKDIASSPQNIDEAKVARLQKLIDEGKYNVDSAAIADRLVDEHLQIPD